MKPIQNAKVEFTANLMTVDPKGVTLNTGGTLTVTGPGSWDGYGLPLKNNGGTFEIKKNAIASFDTLPSADMRTIQQFSGTIKLHSGATLNAASLGLLLDGGVLDIIGDSPAGESDPAKVGGKMLFSSGAITFEGTLWTFTVAGDVTWLGGSFNPRLNVTQNGASDIWNIAGKLTIPNGSTAQIAPSTPGWNPATGIAADWRWIPLRFTTVQLPNNVGPPTVVTPAGQAPITLFPTQINGNIVWLFGPTPG